MAACCLSALQRHGIVMRHILFAGPVLLELHPLDDLIMHWQLLVIAVLLVNVIHHFLVAAPTLPIPWAMFWPPFLHYLFVHPEQVGHPPKHSIDMVDPPPCTPERTTTWTCILPVAEKEDCSTGRTVKSTLLGTETRQRRYWTLTGERNCLIFRMQGAMLRTLRVRW